MARWGRVTLLSPRASRHGFPWQDTLAHELVHLALSRATRDFAPLWLQEGVAKRQEQRWRDPRPFDDPKGHDIRFGIREKSLEHDWKVSAPDYTKEAVDKYIPKRWRTFVGLQIRRALIELIAKIMPKNVTMETYYSGLEPKALEKYELIVSGMNACGYETTDRFRDEDNQKDYWLFTKQV